MFGVFNSIANVLRSAANVVSRSGSNSNLYQYIDATHALRCATVWNSIDIVATGISECEFRAPDHPKLDNCLHYPNSWQSAPDWLYTLAFDQLLYGFAINDIFPNKSNPAYIAPYNPEAIQINANPITREPSYRIFGHGVNEKLSHDRILRIRDSGSNMVTGIRRIDALALRINALIHADQFINSVFDNGIAMSYVATSEKKMSQDEMDKFLDNLKNAFGGKGHSRGGIAIMDDGKTLKEIAGLSPGDANLQKLRLDLIREITSGFGIPPFLGGGDSDTKYNNTSARIQAMYRGAFSPMLNKIQAALEWTFKTPIEFDDSVLIKGDFASQVVNTVALVTAGVWTPNEGREVFDKPEIEGGNVLRISSAPTNTGADRVGEYPTDDGILDPNKRNRHWLLAA